MNKKFKNVIFILVLGSVSAAMLLGIKAYTLPIIERYKEIKFKSTILEAAGLKFNDTTLFDVFDKDIKEKKTDRFTYYLSPKNDYIFVFKGRGLWGMITGVVTIESDLVTLDSIRIISQEETPGLGARITEQQFLNQFKNKKVDPKLVLVLRQKATKDNQIDSITGASITSQALIDMINEAVLNFRKEFKNS